MRKWMRTLQIVLSAIGLAAILIQLEFNLLEATLYDFRMNSRLRAQTSEIVLVTLDDKTTQTLDDYPPLDLKSHLELVQRLAALKPKAIGYLINMNHVYQTEPEQFAELAPKFLSEARLLNQSGIPFVLGTPFDVNGEVLPPAPLEQVNHGIAIVHQDGNVFSEDKVTRRAITYLNGRPTFHLQLAQAAGIHPAGFAPTGSQTIPEVDGEYFLFRYRESTKLSDWDNANTSFLRIPMIDLLRGQGPPSLIENRIVLVGTLGKENPNDFTKTPYSKLSFTNPKLLVHANILDSLIHDNGVSPAPPWIHWILTTVAIGSVLAAVLFMSPMAGFLVSLGMTVALLVLGQLFFNGLFGSHGLWIPLSQPLIGVLLGFYLAVPYRLIREYKKRWDYQKRNEVLTQVESLKRNFLNLVTHDLKTPVARIQGLAEVVMSSTPKESEKDNLKKIVESTDELNRFISSILELSQIQSNELRLNPESKDINQLIERCVESFLPRAKSKNIRIETALEPLFPIKIDANLISKVVNNLIDNALNYSPTGSLVRVSSREFNQGVEIRVEDQGIGIEPEDLENLFTRFFRGTNKAAQQVSGSGLGLYLTKFFVEAHGGHVRVESTLNVGTTFTIWIPETLVLKGLTTLLLKENENVSNTRRR